MRSCLLITVLGLVCWWFPWMSRPHTLGNLSHDGRDGYEHCMRGKSNFFSHDPVDNTGELQAGVGWVLVHLFLPVLDSSQHVTCNHNNIKEQVAIKVTWLVRQWKRRPPPCHDELPRKEKKSSVHRESVHTAKLVLQWVSLQDACPGAVSSSQQCKHQVDKLTINFCLALNWFQQMRVGQMV